MTDQQQQHPITPPPELRRLWAQQAQRISPHDPVEWMQYVSEKAAQWGADTELEACCKWLDYNCPSVGARHLRNDRRPKPPSLKEQALDAMREMQIEPCVINGVDTNAAVRAKYDVIRRALEALPDD